MIRTTTQPTPQLVLAPIKGSPADRAGIQPGDIVTAINGEDTAGWTGEEAAQHLRGQGGTMVRVRLVRHSADQIPGVPGRPPPPPAATTTSASASAAVEVEVSLTRESVALSPLTYAALPAPAGLFAAPALGDSGSSAGFDTKAVSAGVGSSSVASSPSSASASGAPVVGYLRLAAFSANAGDAVADAVAELQRAGAAGFVLDLRANPGGLVQAAADVARVFLDGAPALFQVTGRDDAAAVGDGDVAAASAHEVGLGEGAALTRAPLAVIVDSGSASASEILSGALRDHRRAVIVGDERTYGKGRIQSVFEMVRRDDAPVPVRQQEGAAGCLLLRGAHAPQYPIRLTPFCVSPSLKSTTHNPPPSQDDGSGLFVTVARYLTPAGAEIDLKGIAPDRACGAGGGGRGAPARRGGGASRAAPAAPTALSAAWAGATAVDPASDRCLLAAMDALAAGANGSGSGAVAVGSVRASGPAVGALPRDG